MAGRFRLKERRALELVLKNLQNVIFNIFVLASEERVANNR